MIFFFCHFDLLIMINGVLEKVNLNQSSDQWECPNNLAISSYRKIVDQKPRFDQNRLRQTVFLL